MGRWRIGWLHPCHWPSCCWPRNRVVRVVGACWHTCYVWRANNATTLVCVVCPVLTVAVEVPPRRLVVPARGQVAVSPFTRMSICSETPRTTTAPHSPSLRCPATRVCLVTAWARVVQEPFTCARVRTTSCTCSTTTTATSKMRAHHGRRTCQQTSTRSTCSKTPASLCRRARRCVRMRWIYELTVKSLGRTSLSMHCECG